MVGLGCCSVLEAAEGAPRLREVAWLQATRPGCPRSGLSSRPEAPPETGCHLPPVGSVRLLDDLAEQAGLQAACFPLEHLCWRKRGSR